MSGSPLCVVADNNPLGPFNPTTNGINVSPGDTVYIKLANSTGVTTWFLTTYGTDELSSTPTLTNVDPATGQVTSPTSVDSFT